MENVYIVSAETGMYEEWNTQILCVFSSMEKAEAYKEKITSAPSLPENVRELYSQYVHAFAVKCFNYEIELAEKRLNEILIERAKIKSQLEKALAANDRKKIEAYSKRFAEFGLLFEKSHRRSLERGQISYQECLERALSYDDWLRKNYSPDYLSSEISITEFRVDSNV